MSLPKDHLSDSSNDVVKLGMGLVGTMAALVLGLLIDSAKERRMTRKRPRCFKCLRKIISLDRTLARTA